MTARPPATSEPEVALRAESNDESSRSGVHAGAGEEPAVREGSGLATWTGPSHAAPYALSRMAPAFGLVDAAREIERADSTIATMAGGKLELIAKQMRVLREAAEQVLANAKRDAELHRVKCSFEKQPGGIYHLYRRDSGEHYFSLMAPHEWQLAHAQVHLGSYRLETDMSFTPLDRTSQDDAERAGLLRLLEAVKPSG